MVSETSYNAGIQTNFELISPPDCTVSPDFNASQNLKRGVYPPQVKVESKQDSRSQNRISLQNL